MRSPSPFARELLLNLVLTSGVSPTALVPLLGQIGHAPFAFTLNLVGPPMQVWFEAIQSISAAGLLTAAFLDALAQLPSLVAHSDVLDRVRVAMEMLPCPSAVLAPDELREAKSAARAAKLHDGLGFALLGAEKPLEVGRRASTSLDKREQLEAWFDAANRQEVDEGDPVWMEVLLERAIARGEPSGRPRLQSVLDRLRARVVAEDDVRAKVSGLEQLVTTYGIALDAGEFSDRMVASLARICLVRVDGQDTGTGFLVGPDLVLTAHHVLGEVIARNVAAADVRFVFDYRTSAGVAGQGPSVGLLTASASAALPTPWFIDASEPTAEEQRLGGAPSLADPTNSTHLDFALVRLDSAIGAAPGPSGTARGCFVLGPKGPPFSFPRGAALLIVGHPTKPDTDPPKCSPQVFAIEPDSVLEVGAARVRYRTNTLRGSSGSPVLSAQWDLVALHHYGRTRAYNQGIPTALIAARPAVAAALP